MGLRVIRGRSLGGGSWGNVTLKLRLENKSWSLKVLRKQEEPCEGPGVEMSLAAVLQSQEAGKGGQEVQGNEGRGALG